MRLTDLDALTISADDIERSAEAYVRLDGFETEAHLLSDNFRRPILDRGYLLAAELLAIIRWKSPRALPAARKNTADDVAMTSRVAFQLGDPRMAAHLLCLLHGVRVRMASAILTIFDPYRYTVMDIRAWSTLQALGLTNLMGADLDSCHTFGTYLQTCHDVANHLGVPLRSLDRYLWMRKGQFGTG